MSCGGTSMKKWVYFFYKRQGGSTVRVLLLHTFIIIITFHKNVHNFYARQEVMQWSTDKL